MIEEAQAAEAGTMVGNGPQRPNVWVRHLKFSDETSLDVGRDEIVVFVGPNNAGKSAALKEIHRHLTQGRAVFGPVLAEIEFGYAGTSDQMTEWLHHTAPRNADGNLRLSMVGVVGPTTGRDIWNGKEKRGLQGLANLMSVFLNTEARLTAANPTELVNFVTDVPTHPLQRMWNDDELEASIDLIFHRAFRKHLVVNRSAGTQVMLHIGQKPEIPPGGDRLSNAFREAVNKLPTLHTQGDGMRAFAGIVTSVMAADRDVVFVDEPEAFLHPPQALALGRVLSEQTPKGRQLLVSTHSTDLLRGILDNSSPRVRVIRLTRDAEKNRVTELPPDTVRQVWADPLLRHSRVLDGLFHDGVIVCEGDADCRFYSAMIDVSDVAAPDVHFVYAAGKSRMAVIVRALRSIGVPVRVVADFDVLAEEHDMRNLVEALGGDWADFERDWRVVNAAVRSKRAELRLYDAKKEIDEALGDEQGQTVSPRTERRIKDVLRRGSPWAEAKRVGKSFVPNGEQAAAYEALAKAMRDLGLYVVEEGQLEGFCRTVADHGPAWVMGVLERDLRRDPELEAARRFATALVTDW